MAVFTQSFQWAKIDKQSFQWAKIDIAKLNTSAQYLVVKCVFLKITFQ